MKNMKKIKLVLACICVLAFFGFYQLAVNKIVFGPEPFTKSSKEQNQYNWDAPIYAKLKVDQPLKHYAQKIGGYELERFNIKGVYSSYLKFMCIPDGEDENQRTNTEITLYLTDSELEKSEVNIDIMPSKNQASSFFGTGFSAELAKNDLVKYNVETGNSVGKKTGFTLYLYEREKGGSDGENGKSGNKLITNFGIYINLGKLVIDYTPVTDSREFMNWNRECEAITDSINSKYKK
jgi:hypothetical protein